MRGDCALGVVRTDHDCPDRAGIDGGGVFKEAIASLCKEIFDTDRGLPLANKKNKCYPNPHSYTQNMSQPFSLPLAKAHDIRP